MEPSPKGVFDKAGQAPPPPPKDAAVPSTRTLLPATPIGKFAFYALIPSLLLPLIVTLLSIRLGTSVDWLVVAVFCLVLVGSMALNGWLLLRHSETWRLRAFPAGIAVMLLILWGLLVVGGIVVATTSLNPGTIAIAIALMVLSIVVFVAALIRKTIKTAVVPEVAVGLSRYGAVLGWGYLVAALIGVVVGVFAYLSMGTFGSVAALVVVGLPWSFPLAAIGLLLSNAVVGMVVTVLILAGVALNVVVVVRLLTNAAYRVRFVNWFFKLRGDPKSQIRTFARPASDQT